MRYSAFFAIVIVSAAISFSGPVAAQEASGGGIQQSMTPEQFKAAGLDKLTPKELENLNKGLQGDRETTVREAAKRAEREDAELVISRVDGTFNGLTGRTIIRLEDGSVWKQASGSDVWRMPTIDRPAAAVQKTGFGPKMRIQGSRSFYVSRVR